MKKSDIAREELKFSFKHFDISDSELCPIDFKKNYTQNLMKRLRDLSCISAQDFISNRSDSLRSHPLNWSVTSRPEGFKHLHEQLRRDVKGWQFSVSANKFGRVHGFILGSTFYIVWLDQNHKLYP